MGFPERLKELLKQRHFTMSDLARLAQVNPVTVLYWCRGDRYPCELSMQKLVLSLALSPNTLFWLIMGKDAP